MNKVLLLAPTPPPAGGIAIWTLRMLNSHLINGWSVDVVDEKLKGKRDIFGDKNRRNITEEIVRTGTIWKNLRNKLKKDKEIKIVHSCIPSTTLAMIREYVCCLLSHYYKKKFIMHFRCTTINTTKGGIGKLVFRMLCNISDYIIVLNQASYNHVHNVSDTDKVIIPNFVDEKEVINNKRIRETIKTATYVGGVIESKGCKIICDVAKEFPEIEFRLIGNPEAAIEHYASSIPNVVLTGPKKPDDVKIELYNSDVFLFLSYFEGEGFSNALVEAMAFGIPCIVSEWAANSDMIENYGGVVVPTRDVKSVIDALQYVGSMEMRKRMSDWNILKVKKCYTEKQVLTSYVNLYDKLIHK